jgi:predicted permease
MRLRHLGFHSFVGAVLGLGAGTAVTTVALVDVMDYRDPPHVLDAGRVVDVRNAGRFAEYELVKRSATTVDVAAYRRNEASLEADGGWIDGTVECVTPEYFDVLGVTGEAFRWFSARAQRSDDAAVAILSEPFWRRAFAGAGAVRSGVIQVGTRSFDVAGVAPSGFAGVLVEGPDLWILLRAAPEACLQSGGLSSASVNTVGRLTAGATYSQASAEVHALLSADVPPGGASQQDRAAAVRSIQEARLIYVSREARLARWAAGCAGGLLVIAWLSAAGLVAVHMARRSREIALRRQLGATRPQVVLLLIREQLPVFGISCACGLLAAVWSAAILAEYLPFPPLDALGSFPIAGLLPALCLLGTAVVICPVAVRVSRSDVMNELRTDEPTATRRSRSVRKLLIAHSAIVFATTVGGLSLVSSVRYLWRTAGYDVERTVLITVDAAATGVRSQQDMVGLAGSLRDRIERLPGVDAVALTSGDLLYALRSTTRTGVRRQPASQSGSAARRAGSEPTLPLQDPRIVPGVVATAAVSVVSDDYFAATGTRVVRGRGFGSVARDTGAVMIIDETTAAGVWPGDDPIGQCGYLGRSDACVRIIGIVEARRHQFLTETSPEAFIPLSQARLHASRSTAPRSLIVRTRDDPTQVVAEIAGLIPADAATGRPLFAVRTAESLASTQVRAWLMGSRLFALCGFAGLILGSVGIYASLAAAVRQRTRELGVRIALGASRGGVVWLVCRGVLLAVLAGGALGVGIVAAVGRWLQAILFGVQPLDPGILVTATVAIGCAAGLGALMPAIRAVGIDPAAALRDM